MVPSEQEEVFWVFDLVGEQQADGLQRLLPPVHVIAQEQIVGLRRETSILEQPQQICVLPMDITCRDTLIHFLNGVTILQVTLPSIMWNECTDPFEL